ncbi:MAG TPA: V-type ATP synthase subunit D [Thermoplasmata archaeon]|nr:V-type ATP synthase subunit D [Thermoplasmata archaeon]
MADPITPTRSELIKVKARIQLSLRGHKLLKMKRDGLMYELFQVLPKVKDIRANLVKDYRACLGKMSTAQAYEGVLNIKSIAYTRRTPPTIKVGRKNVMGVVVPTVEADSVKRPIAERGYGVIGTSSLIDETVDAYEALIEETIRAAELETTLKRILDEVEKTKRRVNALEFKVIPELTEVRNFITMRLEEIERENLFRLKKIKAKAEAAEAAAEPVHAAAHLEVTTPKKSKKGTGKVSTVAAS